MNVKYAIAKRRAYRSFEPVEITDETIKELARAAQMTMSCFNNRPWQFVFVRDPNILQQMHKALSQGNEWAYDASMIVAVIAKREDDCIIKSREYFLFDTGMATAFLVLRATELDLVAHPIAGYNPEKTKEVLNIPEAYQLITLVIVGKHAATISKRLSEKQIEAEQERPPRKPLESFAYIDRYGIPIK